MSFDLHAAFVPQALQTLGAVKNFLTKAQDWAETEGHGEAELMEWRIIEDMAPFAVQVKAACMHTSKAVEGAMAGRFQPDFDDAPRTSAGLHVMIDKAEAHLKGLDAGKLNSVVGQNCLFEIPDRMKMPFTAEDFLMSFSMPNYNFHAATAYNILRMKGMDIGKRDWLGTMRLKQS